MGMERRGGSSGLIVWSTRDGGARDKIKRQVSLVAGMIEPYDGRLSRTDPWERGGEIPCVTRLFSFPCCHESIDL